MKELKKLKKICDEVLKDGDCFIIQNNINRFYLTKMMSSYGFVVGFKDICYLLIDSRYYEKACNTVKNCKVVLLEKLSEQLSQLFKKHNAKNILLETKNITLFEYEKYKENFPNQTFLTSNILSTILESARSCKEPFEIENIIKAQRIAEKAFEETLNFVKIGKTEREVQRFLDNKMLDYGAEGVSFDTITLTGANTSMPHGVPSDTKVKDGDFVLFDFGAVYNGYHSDCTRTVCVGTPTDEMQSVYDIVLEAQQLGIAAIKSGAVSKQVDFAARNFIRQKGYGDFFGHSLGHGVGLEIHEFPNLAASSDSIIQTNDVVTVEPGIYLPEKFGVRIEDFGVVTPEGFKNFTNLNKQLTRL